MKEQRVVGGGPVNDWAGLMQDFWQKVESGNITTQHFSRFLKKQHPFTDYPEWIEATVNRERRVHQQNSVGEDANYDLLRATLQEIGKEKVETWHQQGRGVCLLPPDELAEGHPFFKKKGIISPPAHLYEWARGGKLCRLTDGDWVVDNNALYLGNPEAGGTVVLVDTRSKPPYKGGRQMWSEHNHSSDYLELIVGVLRREGKIARYEYGEQSSRFGVSAEEYEQVVFPDLAREDGFAETSWRERSERYIEFLYFCQACPAWPRSKDDKTDTLLWFAEGFGGPGHRLIGGGRSGWGGLAGVRCDRAVCHWNAGSGRPLAVLS